jgi:hypothetical protein
MLFVGTFPQNGNAESSVAAAKIIEMQKVFGKQFNQIKTFRVIENGIAVIKIWLMTVDERLSFSFI